ncbi:MAG: hypothetical protein HKP27_00485 [Myxococcales bacterium]|nr:hypothetical protein [Myxococcales bacterium]
MKLLAWAVLATLLAGCGAETESPAAQIRSVLAAIEEGAEVGDVSAIAEHISQQYADGQGNDRRALVRYIQFHVLRNRRRHLLTREASLEVLEDGRARAVVHAGLVGSPASSAKELLSMRADLYTFDMELVLEEGDWRVSRAEWKRAQARDLF